MQAADTNLLLRALVDDSGAPGQCRAAREWLCSQDRIYLAQVVQLELVWVLDRAFGFTRAEIVEALDRLADHPAVVLQSPQACQAGLSYLRNGGDFADGILAHEAHTAGAQVSTFDRKLARRCKAQWIKVEASSDR